MMFDIDLQGKRVGWGITGSFCTFDQILPVLERVVEEGAQVTPILSYATSGWDTRFYDAGEFRQQVEAITGSVWDTIPQVEPIGPRKLLDVMLVAPCTGNTLAKLANGITDTPVLMAAKSQLRNSLPVVLAISTNDALGNNAQNIGRLLNMRNIYFVPYGQDDPMGKPRSMTAQFDLIPETLRLAMQGEQIQPILVC